MPIRPILIYSSSWENKKSVLHPVKVEDLDPKVNYLSLRNCSLFPLEFIKKDILLNDSINEDEEVKDQEYVENYFYSISDFREQISKYLAVSE